MQRGLSRIGLVAVLATGCAHARAQDAAPGLPPAAAADAPSDELEPLPAGRAIAMLEPERCYDIIRERGVRYDQVAPAQAPSVEQPIRLRGPIGGVVIEPRNPSPVHAIMDCRLAVALLAWAPTLRAAGIDRIQHYSVYRAGARVQGTGRASGHATGLAIDSALYRRADGQVLDVLADWAERERGGPPCPAREAEPEEGRVLRSVVCAAVERDLFQVVLTPHHDGAHQNHVHLEVVPAIPWTYVH